MLLRSFSSPIQSTRPEPESEPVQLKRNKLFTLTYGNKENPTRDPFEKKPCFKSPNSNRRRNSEGDCVAVEREMQTEVEGGSCDGGGGKICGGGGGSDIGDGSVSGSGSFEPENGHDSTDLYYQRMIKADPNNALLLGNYAKFLKECRGDLAKSEEYCERAILANPNDGNALSMYGDLIWQTKRDTSRAESYFDRAVKTDPNDCYVLASYARFLWDAEENKEDK